MLNADQEDQLCNRFAKHPESIRPRFNLRLFQIEVAETIVLVMEILYTILRGRRRDNGGSVGDNPLRCEEPEFGVR